MRRSYWAGATALDALRIRDIRRNYEDGAGPVCCYCVCANAQVLLRMSESCADDTADAHVRRSRFRACTTGQALLRKRDKYIKTAPKLSLRHSCADTN